MAFSANFFYFFDPIVITIRNKYTNTLQINILNNLKNTPAPRISSEPLTFRHKTGLVLIMENPFFCSVRK